VETKFDLNSLPEGVSDLASASLRRVALVSRPDILNALEDYHASESALQLELAKQYPDIHLQPGYEFDQGDNKWALGVSLELPILSHNQGPIAEARARRQESAARFTVLQAKVLAEIDRALDQFHTAETNASLLRELAQTADQRQQNAEAQFKAGAIDQLEVATARLEAVSARLIRLDGQVKLQQAIGALENALQRPLDLPKDLYSGRDQHAAR
jgi:outer membrane protein TolC